MSRFSVFTEISHERGCQDLTWGEQNHPDGTGDWFAGELELARDDYETRERAGMVDWVSVLKEEVMEAFCETNPDELRRELIQVAAVAVAWIEAIDRRPREPK